MAPRFLSLLTTFFHPESTAPAHRATATARFLRDAGWDVEVLTLAPSYPQHRIYDGYGRGLVDERAEDGLRVVRLRPWLPDRARLALRLGAELRAAVLQAASARRRRGGIVLATSPSMFLAQAGLPLARLRGARFVWEIRDLTWRYARATGRRTLGFDAALEQLMLATGRQADGLVTTTEGQRSWFVDRGSAPRRSLVAPNGISDDLIGTWEHATPAPKAPGTFRAVYAGLVGFAQGLGTLLDAAAESPEIEYVAVGDGAERTELLARRDARGLRNFQAPGFVPVREVMAHYRAADVLVAMLRPDPVFAITQPSKIWEYMMTGRPIVYAGEGEAARAVTEAGAGLVVPPGKADALAEAIRWLRDHPEEAAGMGARGRSHAMHDRRRGTVLAELERFLRAIHDEGVAS